MTATTPTSPQSGPAKKQLLLTVSIKDCRVETFRAGGPGGQNQNKRDSACRVHHTPSGAKGESRNYRTQLENKKAAFERMAQHPAFKFWVSQQAAKMAETDAQRQWLRETLSPGNIKVEAMSEGQWEEIA